ncbi:MAG: hypothetical protein GWN18_16150, partial [Thermoplasmata archaeon]|nr:hypothetical protein [Thermoplasmata archaeon]NIS13606.1 hypothetical protein [Thermoplasmata archaeon]NIS21475.1 hypothetical protein [Thermoplasmata archaeon]NIT79039.1 hypothetical protein [Thermoplasmata archaeon]NIU50524.1 hypothetical protein [Thermoplasmata archaeon]
MTSNESNINPVATMDMGAAMSSGAVRGSRASVLAVVVLLGLMVLSTSSPVASASTQAITDFSGGVDNVTVTFKDAATNASAGIDIPRGATIESARMDVEGIFGYADDVRTLDFVNWVTESPHNAWSGTVLGNY